MAVNEVVQKVNEPTLASCPQQPWARGRGRQVNWESPASSRGVGGGIGPI